jgi:predicted nucleic acid-binding protein
MIFVDASFYLRYLVQPVAPHARVKESRAAALFALVDSGAADATTSEAILAEVAFILTSPRHYGASRPTATAGLKALLRPRGCRMPAKEVALRALDIWVAHPDLGFPDALGAENCVLRGYELASFDIALSRAPGVTTYAAQ